MKINFVKYSGTGNDFVVIDNRESITDVDNAEMWRALCVRRTGVGADGVLFIEKSNSADFKMRYLNADGKEAEMCGNGGRVITHFYNSLIETNSKEEQLYSFETMNGIYSASVLGDYVRLKMTELYDIDDINLKKFEDYEAKMYMNTGVPHVVFQVNDLYAYNVIANGRFIRNDSAFKGGTNVNFFEVLSDNLVSLRTYERGVEDETLACGTGAVATAIACTKLFGWKDSVQMIVRGGELKVELDESLENIYLCGKVLKIFSGTIY